MKDEVGTSGFIEKLKQSKNSKVNTLGLSIFRLVISFLIIKNTILFFPYGEYFFGVDGIYSLKAYKNFLLINEVEYLYFPFHIDGSSTLFLLLTLIFALLFFAGVFRWIVGIFLFYFIMTIKFRNGFILDGSDNVIQVLLPFLVLAPSYDFFALNNRTNRFSSFSSKLKTLHHYFGYIPFLGILVQVCFIYFFTALAKLQGDLWLNGTATYYTMRLEQFRHTSLNIPLTENLYFVIFSTYITVFWELTFAFLIWFNKTKYYIMLAGIILHLSIWIFMRIDNFSFIMIGTYFMFITNKEYLLSIEKYNKLGFVKKFKLKIS